MKVFSKTRNSQISFPLDGYTLLNDNDTAITFKIQTREDRKLFMDLIFDCDERAKVKRLEYYAKKTKQHDQWIL